MARSVPPADPDDGRRRGGRGSFTSAARWRRRLRLAAGAWSREPRAWTALFLLTLTFALSHRNCGLSYPDFRPGDISRIDILAPFDLEVPDAATTEARRREERERVLPVFDFDPEPGQEALARLRASFRAARARFTAASVDAGGKPRRPTPAEAEAIRSEFAPPADAEAYRALARRRLEPGLEEDLASVLAGLLRRPILAEPGPSPGSGLTLLNLRTGEVHPVRSGETLLDLDGAARSLRESLLRLPGIEASEAAPLAGLLGGMLLPNSTYDAGETERRREQAAANLPTLVTKIPRGKIIVRKGDEITEPILARLRHIEAVSGARPRVAALTGSFLLLLLLVFFLWRYANYHQRFYTRVRELFLLLILVNLGGLAAAWGILAVADRFAEPGYRESFLYAIPVGASAMLVTLLANARIAMVSSVFFSVLFGMLADWDAARIVFALVSNFAAIFGITQYRQRTALIRAGAAVGAINLIAIFALDSIRGEFAPAGRVGLDLLCGFGGGILTSGLVSVFLPLLESFFHVLTDVRLLELSNLNNPLLRRLALRAPGSYNHSVMVGTLAEAAAEAIRANSLFCRVAAYYHDIGKVNHPEYYIENMRDGVYRHERLSPHLSVLVIQNHVKEGIELARGEGLPEPIIDIIPQHHGTRLIRYFYEKARQEAKAGEEIKEENFRYPGPKPQSKEAAIFMLADSIEAAARTVEEPSPARFKVVIRKIFDDTVLDGQLDECDLTFADLNGIEQAFLQTLLSIYHHRIDYPGFDFDGSPGPPEAREEARGDRAAGAIRGHGWN